jgi:hypothetical protein
MLHKCTSLVSTTFNSEFVNILQLYVHDDSFLFNINFNGAKMQVIDMALLNIHNNEISLILDHRFRSVNYFSQRSLPGAIVRI